MPQREGGVGGTPLSKKPKRKTQGLKSFVKLAALLHVFQCPADGETSAGYGEEDKGNRDDIHRRFQGSR